MDSPAAEFLPIESPTERVDCRNPSTSSSRDSGPLRSRSTNYTSANTTAGTITNSNTRQPIAARTRSSHGPQTLDKASKERFSDDEKDSPFSPVSFGATCLDFTSEDKKREYKFVDQSEEQEVKNVIIRYSDDDHIAVCASYSPPASLQPPPIFCSPPLRTVCRDTYTTKINTPISPIMSTHRLLRSNTRNANKVADKEIVIDDSIDLNIPQRCLKVTIISPPHDLDTSKESDNEEEKSVCARNESFMSLQNFYPELISPLPEECTPSGSHLKLSIESKVQLVNQFSPTETENEQIKMMRIKMNELAANQYEEIGENDKYNDEIYWIENSVLAPVDDEIEKNILACHKSITDCDCEDSDDEELNMLWETATDDLLSECDDSDFNTTATRSQYGSYFQKCSVAVQLITFTVQVISTVSFTILCSLLAFTSISVLQPPFKNMKLSTFGFSAEISSFAHSLPPINGFIVSAIGDSDELLFDEFKEFENPAVMNNIVLESNIDDDLVHVTDDLIIDNDQHPSNVVVTETSKSQVEIETTSVESDASPELDTNPELDNKNVDENISTLDTITLAEENLDLDTESVSDEIYEVDEIGVKETEQIIALDETDGAEENNSETDGTGSETVETISEIESEIYINIESNDNVFDSILEAETLNLQTDDSIFDSEGEESLDSTAESEVSPDAVEDATASVIDAIDTFENQENETESIFDTQIEEIESIDLISGAEIENMAVSPVGVLTDVAEIGSEDVDELEEEEAEFDGQLLPIEATGLGEVMLEDLIVHTIIEQESEVIVEESTTIEEERTENASTDNTAFDESVRGDMLFSTETDRSRDFEIEEIEIEVSTVHEMDSEEIIALTREYITITSTAIDAHPLDVKVDEIKIHPISAVDSLYAAGHVAFSNLQSVTTPLSQSISDRVTPHSILLGGGFVSVLSFFVILSFVLRKSRSRKYDKQDFIEASQLSATNYDTLQVDVATVSTENVRSSGDIDRFNVTEPEPVEEQESEEIVPEIQMRKTAKRVLKIIKEKVVPSISLRTTRRSSQSAFNDVSQISSVPEPMNHRMATRQRK